MRRMHFLTAGRSIFQQGLMNNEAFESSVKGFHAAAQKVLEPPNKQLNLGANRSDIVV